MSDDIHTMPNAGIDDAIKDYGHGIYRIAMDTAALVAEEFPNMAADAIRLYSSGWTAGRIRELTPSSARAMVESMEASVR